MKLHVHPDRLRIMFGDDAPPVSRVKPAPVAPEDLAACVMSDDDVRDKPEVRWPVWATVAVVVGAWVVLYAGWVCVGACFGWRVR